MCEETIPFLLLLAAPVAYFANRAGLLQSPAIRLTLAALTLGILITRAPEAGFEATILDRIKLLGLASTALLLGAAPQIWADVPLRRLALTVLAAASLLIHWNFFAFHGARAFVHEHDVAHYYLGSKYFPEIGYGELYSAIVRADAEWNGGRPALKEARNLRTNVLVPATKLLPRAAEISLRFSEERWQSFLRDAAMMRDRLGPRYPELVRDHGYNPSPVWSLLGGSVASLVPAGSHRGLVALTLLDPVLQLSVFAFVGLVFGLETALLTVIYVSLLLGASFDWIGGSFLRQMWFAGTLGAMAALQIGAGVTGGVLLAIAASLRVFPGLFAIGIAGHVALSWLRTRTLPKVEMRFLVAFAVTGLVLVGATLLTHRGLDDWFAFRANISAHLSGLMSNFVGLPAWARYVEAFVSEPDDPVAGLMKPTGPLTSALLFALAALSVVVAVRLADRAEDAAGRFAAGVWPIVIGLKVSAYYCTYLAVLVAAHRRDRSKLALLFAAEAILYVLALFELHFVMLCLFRSLMMLYLLVAMDFDELRGTARA